MHDEEIINIIKNSKSLTEVCNKIGKPIGGAYFRWIKTFSKKNNIDLSHFCKKSKYKILSKECPICKKIFQCKNSKKENKTTCSYSCSNSFFRRKNNNGSYIDGRSLYGTKYRTICIKHYGHKCLLCEWDKNIDVHHINGVHTDNRLENLVPLCPNHHRMTITEKYKKEINELIEYYKHNFK